MKNWKKHIAVWAAAIIAGSVLFGCGSSDNAESGENVEQISDSGETSADSGDELTIRVADFTGSYWNSAFIVAYQQGLFDDAFGDKDVKVEVSQFANGPAANEAFLAGEVDIMNGIGDQPIIISIGNNVQTTVLSKAAKQEKNIGIIASRNSGVTSVEELKGKRVGVYIGTYVHKSLLGILGENGITENDVEIVNITSTSDADAAFASGDIDAYLALNAAYIIERVDSGEYIKISDLTGYPAYSYIIAGTEFIHDNPEITEEFLSVLKETQDWIEANPEEAYKVIAEYGGTDAETIKNTIEGADISLGLDDESIENLYKTYDFLETYDMITNEVTTEQIDSHIDRSFIDSVLGE